MFEKVNKYHPDKIADRIAGAIVDLAYANEDDPRIAVEVLLGHGSCTIIIESNQTFEESDILAVARRIAKSDDLSVNLIQVPQDAHLARNQAEEIRCGDNGIFKGAPVTKEQRVLAAMSATCAFIYGRDGKYIIDGDDVTVCQSGTPKRQAIAAICPPGAKLKLNPLGDWEGGIDADSGATNRKLGSDMGDGVTGGGLHGKDLSKADVSVNIYAHLLAQDRNAPVTLKCSIGDAEVDGVPYRDIVEIARNYIKSVGGFEKFAEEGLIRSDYGV